MNDWSQWKNPLFVHGQRFHMQGFAADLQAQVMYWSFTDTVIKTDLRNNILAQATIADGHVGDIAYDNGTVYATLLGCPLPDHSRDDWTGFYLLEFDESLHLRQKTELLQVQNWFDHQNDCTRNPFGINGVDGITIAPFACGEKKILLGAGICNRPDCNCQIILQYSFHENHTYERLYSFSVGNTIFGIQNLTYDNQTDSCWFTCYAKESPWHCEETLFHVDIKKEQVTEKWKFDSPYGLACLNDGYFLTSREAGEYGSKSGEALLARENKNYGLILL